MTNTVIPQTDPKAAYLDQRAAIDQAITRVLESGWYILGREVSAFEQEFAAFNGAAHGIGVANGTDALVLGLRALGVGPGDAVVTVSHTAVATVAAIELTGALPVLIDVDECHGMAPDQLEEVLNGRLAGGDRLSLPVKAIVPVHLYGHPVALDRIMDIAAHFGVPVLEDCSQAHGATFDGRIVGTFGALAAFSLYPTKNLGALGDGGVLITNNSALAERLRHLREYGWKERYISHDAGHNSRLDELQAAILRVKLEKLGAHNARRQAIAEAYDRGLDSLSLERPRRRPNTVPVFHQYVVTTPSRDALRTALQARGIMTNIHYPAPVHLQPAYLGRLPHGPGGLPQTERMAGLVLSLPMYPQLGDEAVASVVAALRDVVPSL
ncbi:erythromycin biosynthesis sensory transduction protein eryC1 (plasmid) [Azospirillum argentinense]|uniref:Erythromycin biosynthesis sensory transduction protein eryC1 n=1 Tax=Azospirillum argentinense TaxID=2970906 RepID=A0A060E0A0_9PROT|nr:DegT/DnrJ/EryC1/StrS family aminotransferase [Azospirillum argentinense]AIB16678.1 erythromycin biosynthesis sensory transduction protein eryC1 [Azospirillum argentinense]EZQ02289.1 erythromycin biosynthesis sensory transduction protein eryC1 [Azospirillum argentinense]